MNRSTWMKVIAFDMLLVGFALTISVVGQMLGAIGVEYDLNLAQSGMLLSVQSIGGLVLSVLFILYIDVFNRTKVLVLCALLMCLLLIIIGTVPPLFMLFVIFALLGFSGASVNTLTTPLLGETVAAKPARFIIFMHMLFSLCAGITPFVAQALYETGGLSGTFYAIGLFGLCWAVYSAFVFKKTMRIKPAAASLSFSQRFAEAKKVFLKRGMKQVFIIAILISAWQLSALYYMSSYFTQLTGDAQQGAVALSVLFFSMMISRLIYSRFADKLSPGRVMMITSLLGMLAWIAIFVTDSMIAKTVFAGLSAFFCANSIPLMFATACKIAPENAASATAFAIFGYYIATFSFVPSIGALGDAIGLDRAFIFACVPLLFIVPAGYLLHKRMTEKGVT